MEEIKLTLIAALILVAGVLIGVLVYNNFIKEPAPLPPAESPTDYLACEDGYWAQDSDGDVIRVCPMP